MKVLSVKKYNRNKLAGFGWLNNDFEIYEIIVLDKGEAKAFNANLEMVKKGMFEIGSINRNLPIGSGYTSWNLEKVYTIHSFLKLINRDVFKINDYIIDEKSK